MRADQARVFSEFLLSCVTRNGSEQPFINIVCKGVSQNLRAAHQNHYRFYNRIRVLSVWSGVLISGNAGLREGILGDILFLFHIVVVAAQFNVM